MTSPDPVRTDYENEMEDEIRSAFARFLSARDIGVPSYGLVRAAVEPILVDLRAAREDEERAWRDKEAAVVSLSRQCLAAEAEASKLRSDLAAAREEIAAVERALEGVEETPLARRVGHWIGVAAEETARANAAEAELASLRVQLQGSAINHIARDLSDDLQEAEVSKLRERVATLEEEKRGWKSVAVIAAIPLEAMRMAGSYRALAPSTQTCVDEAVVTIRMAVAEHGLPPDGDIDAALAPARSALSPLQTEKQDG